LVRGQCPGGIGNIPPAPDTFNPDILNNEKKTLIEPYIKNIKAFKCPADARTGVYSGTNPSLKGQKVDAVRSISMNQGVGTVDPAYDRFQSADYHEGVPTLSVNGPWLNGKDTHHRNQPYATFGKTTDFRVASASQIFLTLDESPWSINDAAFGVSAAVAQWVDWPAIYHNNACGFSFCDGHAELHRWQTSSLSTSQRTPPTFSISADNADWIWLKDHATVKLQ
jgi:prepilin-type processing-associated H-X9-DG protein